MLWFFKKILQGLGIFFLVLFILLVGFVLWAKFPPLPSVTHPKVVKLPIFEDKPPPPILTVASYNIQYGIGFNGRRTDALDAWDFYERLYTIANILKAINADIVLLQEVDFRSERTHNIDQAYFLALKAGYQYLAKAPHWKTRLLPDLNGHMGPLNHGLAVLSRYPLTNNESHVFDYPSEAPFYVRWLYSPHGGQKVVATLGKEKINIVNVHLEPWAQKTRERSVKKIVKWIKSMTGPMILGGDFNAIPPEAPIKTYYNLEDTPWFIDKNQWNLDKDITINAIRKIPGLTDAIPPEEYLKNDEAAFTYPADKPTQRLDYLFAGGGAKIIKGYVYKAAGPASDHLPVVAEVEYNSSGNNAAHHSKSDEHIPDFDEVTGKRFFRP